MRDGVCFEKENAVANDTKSATTWGRWWYVSAPRAATLRRLRSDTPRCDSASNPVDAHSTTDGKPPGAQQGPGWFGPSVNNGFHFYDHSQAADKHIRIHFSAHSTSFLATITMEP